MATLWIREYTSLALVGAAGAGGDVAYASPPAQIPNEPGTDQSSVTYSTSAQSAAFAAGTRYIAMSSAAAFHYVVGADPTATTNARRVAADETVFIGVIAGQKVAAIAAA